MYFIDSHAHLNDPAFDTDREELLHTKLPQAGLCASVEIGCACDEWEPALTLSENFPGFVGAVLGIHPEYAVQYTAEQAARLNNLVQDKRVLAIGETGLDYTCLDVSNKELQLQTFSQMITLANQTKKPLVLHVRREGEDYSAYEDTFHILKHEWKNSSNTSFPGVLHCFCADYETAKKALDKGLLLGINGCFTYKKNEYIREAVKKAGVDKIILETDCPYLSPQGKRGTRNDPSNIPLIAQFVADYLNISLAALAEKTTRHAKELYGLN